jgi:predicted alpha/beta superfamily hydrolase
LLIERGAQIDAVSQNHMQNTALHAATAAKRSSVVLALLQAGADANARQKNGQTALHQAVENYDINMVQMLLDFKADASLQDGRGMSAVRLADSLGYAEILQMLERNESASEGQSFKGRIVYLHNFFLPELNALRTLRIYLPPGYEQSEDRYPVLYMHDGQNLFEKQTSSYGMCWEIANTIDEWVEQGSHPGFIVVGVDNNREGLGRYHEYSPWESEIVKQYIEKASHEHRVGGDGFAYLDCIVHTIKPYIDKHYRTQNEKEQTLIGGSSMGGYISLAAAFAYGDVFGKILACSTAVFFEEKELTAYIQKQSKSAGQRIYMDIGSNETSNSKLAHFPAIYAGSNERLYQLLRSKGYVSDLDIRYVIEENAEHNEFAWARRFPAAIKWLFAEQFK